MTDHITLCSEQRLRELLRKEIQNIVLRDTLQVAIEALKACRAVSRAEVKYVSNYQDDFKTILNASNVALKKIEVAIE